MKLIFNGAGWKLFYYLGICKYLQMIISKSEMEKLSFEGASAGSWMCLLLITETPAEIAFDYWIKRSEIQRSRKSFFRRFDTNKSLFRMYNLYSIHDKDISRISKRLSIYVTSPLLIPKKISYFKSRKDLFHVLMASTTIPVLTSRKIFYRLSGNHYFDGGIWPIPKNNYNICIMFLYYLPKTTKIRIIRYTFEH